MNLQEELEAPRFTKSRPTGCDVIIEARVGLDMLRELSSMGHQITLSLGENNKRYFRFLSRL